jgi:hypothetical protein
MRLSSVELGFDGYFATVLHRCFATTRRVSPPPVFYATAQYGRLQHVGGWIINWQEKRSSDRASIAGTFPTEACPVDLV